MSSLAQPLAPTRPSAPVLNLLHSSAAAWGLLFSGLSVVIWGASLVIGFPAALSMLMAMGFAAAILGLRWPVPGLLGIGMLCTLDTVTRNFLLLGGVLRFNTFNYWLVLVIVLAAPRLLRLQDPHARLLQWFLIVLGLGLLSTTDLVRGVQHVLNLFIVFGLLVYFLRAVEEEEVWYWLGVVSGVVAGAGGLAFFLHRSALQYVNPNSVTHFPLTALFCICLAAHFVSGRSRPLLVLGVLATVNIVWVFLTGSRGGLLMALFCSSFLLLEVRGFSRRLLIVALASLLGVAVVSQFTALQEKTIHRVEKLFDTKYSMAGRTSGRSDLALGGLHMFLEHPFGVGTGSFSHTWAKMSRIKESSGSFYHREKAAHSGWVKTLAENGLPGILLQIAFVTSFALAGWGKRREGLFSLGMLVTGVFGVAFISTEFQGKGLWLLAAGVIALLHYHPQTRPSSAVVGRN
jgi:O-antigen ligase